MSVRAYTRSRRPLLNTMPGTKPPPWTATLFHVYGTAATARAVPVTAVWTATTAVARARSRVAHRARPCRIDRGRMGRDPFGRGAVAVARGTARAGDPDSETPAS